MTGAPLKLLSKAVKTALDETHLLILGAQVLLGFQLQVMFREPFAKLPALDAGVCKFALLPMVLVVALLVAPSMQHRLVEGGEDSPRLLRAARHYAVAALVPSALAIAADFHVVFAKHLGRSAGWVVVVALIGIFVGLWLLFPLLVGRGRKRSETPLPQSEQPSLEHRIEQMLTEARVILPGVQALLGFQLIACFAEMYERLPWSALLAHDFALVFNAIGMALLMTPARCTVSPSTAPTTNSFWVSAASW